MSKLTQEQTTTTRNRHTFHPRVINNNNIAFSSEETALLQKGLKYSYNLHSKKKNWIQNLALEAETSITQLPTSDREFYRNLVADHIDTLQSHISPSLKHKTHPESRKINSMQTTFKNKNAVVTVPIFLVILPIQQYESKIQNFLQENNFQASAIDLTKSFQT